MKNKKLWGGRFRKQMDKDFERFSKSIQYDYILAEFDIYHSLIHIEALAMVGILTGDERAKLTKILKGILKEIRTGKIIFSHNCEDVHTDIQNRVAKSSGKLALKLHALRSRNDQVAFDERCYCLVESGELIISLRNVIGALRALANKYSNEYFPAYTHLQRAQVVRFSQYLESFSLQFSRDTKRLEHFKDTLTINIGSGAVAGTPIDRAIYERAIKRVMSQMKSFKAHCVYNPLDHVSNRDFVAEFLSILAILQLHLSRLAEDFILYATKEFGFLDLPEEFCTGSSLMPHKKNPDFLELMRGYTGRIYGNLMALLTTMKSLPLTYNRDMQLDKEPLFASVAIVKDELALAAKFIRGVRLNTAAVQRALVDESFYATELAEFLVFKGVPFAHAHHIVGKLIRYSEDRGVAIRKMDDNLLRSFHPQLSQKDIKRIMIAGYAVSSKRSGVAKRLARKR